MTDWHNKETIEDKWSAKDTSKINFKEVHKRLELQKSVEDDSHNNAPRPRRKLSIYGCRCKIATTYHHIPECLYDVITNFRRMMIAVYFNVLCIILYIVDLSHHGSADPAMSIYRDILFSVSVFSVSAGFFCAKKHVLLGLKVGLEKIEEKQDEK